MEMSKAKPEKKALPARFYAAAEVQQNADGFCIMLDGKSLRTQGRHLLQVHSAALAEAIAAEWQVQSKYIDPDTMPLTRMANLAIDRAASEREAWLEEICRYGETDLLCYRVPAETVIPAKAGIHLPHETVDSSFRWNDETLRQCQDSTFAPILAWAAGQGVPLNVTEGVMPIAQPGESLRALRRFFETATDPQLAALAMLTPLLGSAVLALALWQRRITVEEALAACRLDEDFQAAQWGEDGQAAAAWASKRRDIMAAAFFLDTQTL